MAYFIARIAQPPQARIDGVLAHGARASANRRENETRRAGDSQHLAEQVYRLPGQRNLVRLAHFHLARPNHPKCAVQIELAPLGMAQLPGADKDVRGDL